MIRCQPRCMKKEDSIQQSTYNLLVSMLAPIESGLSDHSRLRIVLGSLILVYLITVAYASY
jgi:hypothetical protein